MPAQKLKIEKLVSGGHGLGYLDGQVILVPYSAPGDEALLEVAPTRKGVAWGSIKQILSPSPSRVSPFCIHYGECGGCQLQHIAYPAQLEYKRLIVQDALRRIAGLKDVNVEPCVASPAQTAYRSRVRLHCDSGKIGFHRTRSNKVEPVEHCPILSDNINICLREISSYLSTNPIAGLSEIQMMESDSGVILLLEMISPPAAAVAANLKEAMSASGAAAKVGGDIKQLWGHQYSTVTLENKSFRVSPGSFFQANTSLLPALVQQLSAAIQANHIETALELYAGVGLFSTMLADKATRLLAAEWNRDAAKDALVNLNLNRIKNVEVIPASAEDALERMISEDVGPELVVLDPPRDGLSTAVRSKLMQLSPRQLVYISCDPATLARDIKSILSSGKYLLEKLTPLDMFPHTAHIECVCTIRCLAPNKSVPGTE